jgi:D-sedoheptulose 7-phosphate isomerase
MNHSVEQAIADHLKTIEGVKRITDAIIEAAYSMSQALRKGNKILVMGNGGSAADAQHLAAELVGRFLRERKALPAIALTTDTSILTAVGNDYGYETVFARQVDALAKQGDVVVGISTSGNSANVLKALDRAKEIGCLTIGLSGGDGGKISTSADLSLVVASPATPRIQEGHILVIHILCDLVEQEFA